MQVFEKVKKGVVEEEWIRHWVYWNYLLENFENVLVATLLASLFVNVYTYYV